MYISSSISLLQVRNIPNKYNQQMLLEEVNQRHEGTYDFFYLPIDFKNRCNVGYCFINFLEARHIAPFVHEFNGQRWKSFNSEKVCAVSFARIQGKQAMVARFQNSSLLEKDDEYRPLLFHSTGPDRGRPEPFPAANNNSSHAMGGNGSNRGRSGSGAPPMNGGGGGGGGGGGSAAHTQQLMLQQQQQMSNSEGTVLFTSVVQDDPVQGGNLRRYSPSPNGSADAPAAATAGAAVIASGSAE